jgi:glycosyltransferase involved in cell wall biosynthesis
MRILVDCANIRTGGALQNGLSFLDMASRDSRHEWHVVVSTELGEQLPSGWQANFASAHQIDPVRKIRDFLRLGLVNHRVETRVAPDLVFTLAGPAYWRAKAPHISGFAKPQYLYPNVRLFDQLPLLDAWRGRAKLRTRLAIHRYLFTRSDYLVGQTETVRRRAVVMLGFPADRFFVARNSFSPIFRAAIASLGTSVPRRQDICVIFVPSAYYPHKNLEIIPRVAELLAKRTQRRFLFRLTLDAESAEWRRLHAQACALGVSSFLEAIGKVPHADLARRYLESDIVFLPTLLECSTAVYPEAMSAGIPIVTSDLDFARESCGQAAVYFDPYDPKAAASALVHLVHDPAVRHLLATTGARELPRIYPSPEAKYEEQIAILEEIGRREAHRMARQQPDRSQV